MVPLPWYSSDIIRSRSSLLRSMPIYQAQLKRTAFRSFAPAAGVYSGPRRRPGRPPASPSPPRAPAPWAGAVGAEPPACANAEDGPLTVRATAIAILVPKILCRTAMMISLLSLLARVTGGDLDHAPVRHDHRLEEPGGPPSRTGRNLAVHPITICRCLALSFDTDIATDETMKPDNRIMDEREAMRRWVETWKEAGPALEAIRRREVKELDTLETIACLEGAFNYAVRNVPPDPSSGLVELHEWLAKLPR